MLDVGSWDGYPPDRANGEFHWIRLPSGVTDSMLWWAGKWHSSRLGEKTPEEAREWTYEGPNPSP